MRRGLVIAGLGLLLAGSLGGGCALVLGFEDTNLKVTPDGAVGEGGGKEDDAAIDSGPVVDGRLAVEPRRRVLRRGSEVTLDVTVDRGTDITGDVVVKVEGLPTGVTQGALTIAAGTSTGVLPLRAGPNAALGASTVRVAIENSSIAPIEVALLVADRAGGLDATFDTDGFAVDASKGVGSTFYGVLVQADGKIVAVGAGAAPTAGWLIRRFLANGAPDTAFNNALPVLPTEGEARAVAVDATGKLVVVGSSPPAAAGVGQLTVVRLASTGAIDTTFDGGFVRATSVDAPQGSAAYGVAVRPDDGVVVVGARTETAGAETGVAVRMTKLGARDAVWGTSGVVLVPSTRLVGVAVDTTATVLAGTDSSQPLTSYLLTRRGDNGAPDTAFGTGGTLTFGLGYGANAFARLPTGSLALAGESIQAGNLYTAGLASAQGGAAWVRGIAISAGAAYYGLAATDDGLLVAAGHTSLPNGEARVDRIKADGVRDDSFGDAGATILEPAGSANALDVKLFAATTQRDGRIVVAGNRSTSGAVIYRLWP